MEAMERVGMEGEGGADSDLRLSLLCVFLGGH